MADRGFDVNRSQVSADALARFLAADLGEDLGAVPGVGPKAKEMLAADDEGGAVRTTFQLVGKFLCLRAPGMTTQEHCDAFWHWLKLKGVDAHRSGIVHAIAEKTNLMIPGIYTP